MHFHTHELNLDFFPFVNVSYVNLISSAKELRREEKKGFPPLSWVPKIYTPNFTVQHLPDSPEISSTCPLKNQEEGSLSTSA